MLDYEIEMYAPGRRCPLTEERCFTRRCKSACYGLDAAKGLKESFTGNMAMAARAFNAVAGDLPIETQKAIGRYLDREGQHGSDVYEDFMDRLLKRSP